MYFQGDKWPIGDSSVDCILCTETLEHVLNTKGFLEEAWTCLAPAGRLLLAVPFAARWHFIPYDYWRFTPSSLKYLLGESGFVDVEVYARGNAGTVACYKVMALILVLVAAQNRSKGTALLLRMVGTLLLPLLLLLAIVANLTLLGSGGNDCLGYTVIARKSASTAP